MSEDQGEIKRVNWSEMFAFTRVFKSFRLAQNLSSLALAFSAIVLICLAGWIMDGVATWTGRTVRVGEIRAYSLASDNQFATAMEAWHKSRPGAVASLNRGIAMEQYSLRGFSSRLTGRLKTAFDTIVSEKNEQAVKGGAEAFKAPEMTKLLEAAEKDWADVLGKAKDIAKLRNNRIEDVLSGAAKKAREAIDQDSNLAADEDRKAKAHEQLDKAYIAAQKNLTLAKMDFRERVEAICGRDISDSFIAYEGTCLKDAVSALLSGNISAGLAEYRDKAPVGAAGAEPGFLVHVFRAIDGFKWLFSEHWLYGGIFVLISLAIWALFGGAIHRIAALQVAREEKISYFEALRFSRERFLSFFMAPLAPLGVVLVLGVILMVGGLATNIPYVGPIIVGLLFVFALLLGLLIAFLLVGLVAGVGLMYPTIAVEGSDTLDAMSRGYTYVYQKPWHTALYTVAALLHGSICYVFVRFFAFLALTATHFFVRGAVWTGGNSLPEAVDADKMDVLWTAPTFRVLHSWNWDAMTGWQAAGAMLMMIWVYAIIALVAAFAITYAAGSMTTIYIILRRKVDATDLDDVYLEEEESVEGEQFPSEPSESEKTEPAPTATAAEPPQAQTPPDEPDKSRNIRVFELARELGVQSKVVLDKCKAHDLQVSTHMESLSAAQAADVRQWFASAGDNASAGDAEETPAQSDDSQESSGDESPQPNE